jgi:8-oxo-dGTP pyrophosphatase MutT (NUDIX family)
MEPELAYGRHFGPPSLDARPAAVIILLHWINDAWYLPLTVRPDSLSHHAGQISLPGGLIETGETSEEAALRELDEELGVNQFQSVLLGQLSPIFLYGSNFLITPWVASTRSSLKFKVSVTEVHELLQVPLAHFQDPRARGQHIERSGSVLFLAPHFQWQDRQIWGATAVILAEFTALVAEIRAAV